MKPDQMSLETALHFSGAFFFSGLEGLLAALEVEEGPAPSHYQIRSFRD